MRAIETPRFSKIVPSNAVVLVDPSRKRAFKVARDLRREYEAHCRLCEANGSVEHVVTFSAGDARIAMGVVHILELEYVDGQTLAELLAHRDGGLSPEEVLRYAQGVCAGLLELRRAGLFHRDLHDRNVIVQQGWPPKARILDLGCATGDPCHRKHGNRAFGGNNDLVSLGQLMFKMATGRNLFNTRFRVTAAAKDDVRHARETAYADPRGLRRALRAVRRGVPGHLGELIAWLMDDDLWTQPGETRVRVAFGKLGAGAGLTDDDIPF